MGVSAEVCSSMIQKSLGDLSVQAMRRKAIEALLVLVLITARTLQSNKNRSSNAIKYTPMSTGESLEIPDFFF